MTHYNIFNYKGFSESREVARGPKDPPPGVIGLKIRLKFIEITEFVQFFLMYDEI